MGGPRNLSKKYQKPNQPYNKERIVKELEYIGRYGLRNKKEFWIHRSQLGNFRGRARALRSMSQEVQNLKFLELKKSLSKYGLFTEGMHIDDILELEVDQFLERRLQTIIFKKGLAKNIHQSRQFVTHRHIQIGDKIIDSPSHLVTIDQESKIQWAINSPYQKISYMDIQKGGASAAPAEKKEVDA